MLVSLPTSCNAFSVLALAAALSLASDAQGQFSADPALNFSVADGGSDQILPKIEPTADGGCFVSWFGGIATGFDVRLQRLDANGVEQWPHNGILVMDRSFSSVQDYGLDLDASGAALLSFRDDSGTSVQITAQRVTAAGALAWGTGGVQVSNTTSFVGSPKIAGTTSGDIVVAWTEGSIARSLRLNGNGVPLWSVPVDSLPTTGNYFVSDLHATGDNVILSIVHQVTTSFFSPKHLVAQKYNATGSPLWGSAPVAVFDSGSLQFGNFPPFIVDGSGGAVFSWYGTGPLQCYAQHILSSGAEAFPHNGSVGSSNTSNTRVSPSVAFDSATSTTYMFWEEQNGSQTQSGLAGQKFGAAGSALWGATGSTLIPLSSVEINWVRALCGSSGIFVSWHETVSFGNDTGQGAVVADNGSFLAGPIAYASTPSNKTRLFSVLSTNGDALMAWSDDRVDSGDVLLQNMQPDGSLGNATAHSQFCFGNGCPCGNDDPSAGCKNGTTGGARLDASGSPKVAAGSWVLEASSLPPNKPGLYFQGDVAINGGHGVPVGDGLRCVGSAVVRLQVRTSDALGNSFTTVNLAAGVNPGDLHTYQLWYRDPAGSVCGAGFNLTNGVQLIWLP